MLIKFMYIFIMNIVTFGGGGVYIPVYKSYYVDIFKIMNYQDFMTVVSISNIIPGITGGKLAAYAMFLEYNIIGLILAMVAFVAPGVMMVLIVIKIVDKIKENPIFIKVNIYLKPVIVGILLTITYDFLKNAYEVLNGFIFIGLIVITYYLLKCQKIKIFNIIVVYLIITTIIVVN